MNKPNSEKIKIPFLMTFIGSVLLLIMILLPYASAKDDYKEYLKSDPKNYYVSEIKMTNASAVNISMLEYSRIYAETARQGIYKEVSIICIVLISLFALFSLLALLMSLLKKATGIIIFDLLALAVFWLIHFDYADRGVLPTNSYGWGIANYLTYIVGIVVATGAVWLFVEKRKFKRLAKKQQVNTIQE